MIVIPINAEKKTYIVVIIEKDNLERMKQADPITINSVAVGGVLDIHHPHDCQMIIAYEEDSSLIQALAKNKDLKGLLAYINRGFTFDPSIDGDEHNIHIGRPLA